MLLVLITLVSSSLLLCPSAYTSTTTVTNTAFYPPEIAQPWHEFCHDSVNASSYCKLNHVPSVCQFSLVLCGPSLSTTDGTPSDAPSPPTTTSIAPPSAESTSVDSSVVVSTPEVPTAASPSPLPTTPSIVPLTTTSVGIETSESITTTEISSTSYSADTSEPVTTTEAAPTNTSAVASTVYPTTETIPTPTPATTTESCETSGSCSPDPEGAVRALADLLGPDFVLTGGSMPPVYMAQYTYIAPAAVVRPGDSDDIIGILGIAVEYRVPVVVRSYAGHSFAGQSTVQDGIVILMDRFSSVGVLPEGFLGSSYTAVIGAGTRLLDIYVELMQHSPPLGVSGGNCPSVSISGVTMGGAHGYYGTKYGTLADAVIAADVVVKDGDTFKLVTATRDGDHAELLKALRGGMGGNYGVVVNWYIETFRASETVNVFRHKVDRGDKDKEEVVGKTRAFEAAVVAQPGDGLWSKFKIKGGFEMNFEGMCMCEPISNDCSVCDASMASIDAALDKDNWVSKPSELTTDHGYATWSWAGCTQWADPEAPSTADYPGAGGDFDAAKQGCYDYDWSLSASSPWKSISVYIKHSDATESFWDAVWDVVHEPECENRNLCILTFEYYGGKMIEEPQDCSGDGPCTSFIHRNNGWNIQIASLYSKGDSVGEQVSTSWVAKAFAAIDAKSSLHTSYQNYLSNQWTLPPWRDEYFPGQDVEADHWKYRFFGDGLYSRLQQVKCQYNPDNLFVTADTSDIVVQLPDSCST
ncbi:hypothetical protein FOZ61_002840 [Perkinsus olseni]|uniref:FAD-binding PCMH-type domain-containing protein n=1 Tax=Perkinsus olseni TaxID=32597 RepID=A0A7J6LRV6_PEROL|nr:hypothetical protein FOZ61_002840 [Perkinsus olseni]